MVGSLGGLPTSRSRDLYIGQGGGLASWCMTGPMVAQVTKLIAPFYKKREREKQGGSGIDLLLACGSMGEYSTGRESGLCMNYSGEFISKQLHGELFCNLKANIWKATDIIG